MFDRKRSEGATEKGPRDGGKEGRDGCQSEKIIVPQKDAAIRVTFSRSAERLKTPHSDWVTNLVRCQAFCYERVKL